MQLIGLLIGILGVLILTLPNELYALFYLITRCKKYVPPKTDEKSQVSENEIDLVEHDD